MKSSLTGLRAVGIVAIALAVTAISASAATAAQVLLPNPDQQIQQARPAHDALHPVAVSALKIGTPSDGFDCGDAVIGAGAVLALIAIALTGTRTATSRRRHTRHQRAAASS
jgi:hypothetical protein